VTPMATISSKGQLVIPAELRKKYKLKAGSRVAVHDRNGHISVTPDPYDALLSLRGILRGAGEDVEAWMREEKRKESDREEARYEDAR
jgi:AbrB family looped-hinge helix DNA binding protein